MSNKISNVPYRLLSYEHSIDLESFYNRDIDLLFDDEGNIHRPYSPEAHISLFTLDKVEFEDLEEYKIYVNNEGHSIQYTPNDKFKFKFITRSPLYLWKGAKITDLNEMQLRLFWILTYNAERGYGV